MRLHPREQIVGNARDDLRKAISDWGKNHPELTGAEYLQTLMGVCHDSASSLLKIEIRLERHGDADKPGSIE